MKFLVIELNKTVKFWWKLVAFFKTSNQNNSNRMILTTKQIYTTIRKHLKIILQKLFASSSGLEIERLIQKLRHS